MHKESRQQRRARERQEQKHGERIPKTRWSRFLLPIAGLVIAGGIAVAAFSSRDPAPIQSSRPAASPVRVPAPPHPSASRPNIEAMLKDDLTMGTPNGPIVLRRADIEKIFQTDSTVVLVAKQGSDILAQVERAIFNTGHLKGKGITIGAAIDPRTGMTFGLSLIHHPSDRGSTMENTICDDFTHMIRSTLTRLATQGDLNEMKQFLARLDPRNSFRPDTLFFRLYELILTANTPTEARWFVEHMATECIVLRNIYGRTGADYLYDDFLNLAVHEGTHGLQARYKVEQQLAHLLSRWEVNETFGVCAEIAYGETPWLGIEHVLGTYWPTEIEGVDDLLPPYLREVQKTSPFFAQLLGRLLGRLGIEHLIEILGKSDAELRAAARSMLDEESMRYYGKPFAQVVPLEELQQILDQGRAYITDIR